jgi:hypothetical protein
VHAGPAADTRLQALDALGKEVAEDVVLKRVPDAERLDR